MILFVSYAFDSSRVVGTFLVKDFGQKSHLKLASAGPCLVLPLLFPLLPPADVGG